jgi:hypothetical protein
MLYNIIYPDRPEDEEEFDWNCSSEKEVFNLFIVWSESK